jgi:hypothetical protein
MTTTSEKNHWLVLIHQLPKDPAYLRVKIGRRLSGIGALALKNSVYVLPKSDVTSEDFQWVRREILEGGGEATVLDAELVEGLSDEQVESKFREAKDIAYSELIREAEGLLVKPRGRRKRPLNDEERALAVAAIARLERRFEELGATDFFGASQRDVVRLLLADLRTKVEPEGVSSLTEPVPEPPRARTWVTRTGIHVDRIASAWLIRRFIDPEANFKYVAATGYVPEPGELRFDMFEAEYSHEGDMCSFEVLCQRFSQNAPALRVIGELIHDLDLKDGKFDRPETPGLAAQLAGLTLLRCDDEARLARGSELFDELFAHFSVKEPH